MRHPILITLLCCLALDVSAGTPSPYSAARVTPNPASSAASLVFTVHVAEGYLEYPATISRSGNSVTIIQPECIGCTSPAVLAHDHSIPLGHFDPSDYHAYFTGTPRVAGPALGPTIDVPFSVLGTPAVALPMLAPGALVVLVIIITAAALVYRRKSKARFRATP